VVEYLRRCVDRKRSKWHGSTMMKVRNVAAMNVDRNPRYLCVFLMFIAVLASLCLSV
jgi:hypothetical protein